VNVICCGRVCVRRPYAPLLAIAVGLSGACATGRGVTTAGTGDISFKLLWTGPADLDLHVTDPHGEEISFSHRRAASGGTLDIDCNATPEQMCAHPIENVFWPRGTAASGRYTYLVHFMNQHESPLPITFTVLVLHGTRIVHRDSGSFVTYRSSDWGPREIVWSR
jgi:hypothetical protein